MADGGGVGDFPNAALAFNVTPTGNGFPTMSTLSVQVRMVELDTDINEQWSAVGVCLVTLAFNVTPTGNALIVSG